MAARGTEGRGYLHSACNGDRSRGGIVTGIAQYPQSCGNRI